MVKAAERIPHLIAAPSARTGNSSRVRPGDVQLEQVTPIAWRVCDTRFPPGHPKRLLGCIDQRRGAFELMQLDGGFHWDVFVSLNEALEHAALRGRVPDPAPAMRPQVLSAIKFW